MVCPVTEGRIVSASSAARGVFNRYDAVGPIVRGPDASVSLW